ncbi:transposable element Tcb2 transposase [Trichonephila clavipes]|nr:transposable element Tcb2 transposase [Trichonephila clavipes]
MANNQSVRRHLDAFTRGRIIGKLEEGRSVTSVAAEFGIAHSIVSGIWRQFQTTGTAIWGSVVVVHEEPHPQMTGTLSYRPEETGGRQREKSLDTRHRRLDDRYRVLPWPEDCTVVRSYGSAVPFHGRQCTVAAEQLLESEDIERMDWPARSQDLNPIAHVWDFLGRRLAARTLPPVTIRELRLALQDEWAAMPQQLIDTLILSMGRRCETCLAVREIISPTKDRMFLAGHPHRDVSAFSRIALHATFSIKLLMGGRLSIRITTVICIQTLLLFTSRGISGSASHPTEKG